MDTTASLRLKASKQRSFGAFCAFLVFLVVTLAAQFPPTAFYFVFRALLVPTCLLGMAIFVVGVFTDRYDAVLSPDGIKFGTFSGKRHYRWPDIKAVYVLREVTGRR